MRVPLIIGFPTMIFGFDIIIGSSIFTSPLSIFSDFIVTYVRLHLALIYINRYLASVKNYSTLSPAYSTAPSPSAYQPSEHSPAQPGQRPQPSMDLLHTCPPTQKYVPGHPA